MFDNQLDILVEHLDSDLLFTGNCSVSIKREDRLHSFVSGNKFRKLKYNIQEAQRLGHKKLLTFGGAYSNHIAATAYAGNYFGLTTYGIIRGDELATKVDGNPTLQFAKKHGMQFEFISREQYRKKNDPEFIEQLNKEFGSFYLLPEGGTNALAVKGCEEILIPSDSEYDYICASVGTGGTLAGLINGSLPHQTVLGFSALKGVFQKNDIKEYISKTNFDITDSYCFGGYAKIDSGLVRFINEFKENTGIPLDPVYTGKMMYGIMDLLKNGYFKENSRILAIHTGGLQGIKGMNQLLKKKNLPQINL